MFHVKHFEEKTINVEVLFDCYSLLPFLIDSKKKHILIFNDVRKFGFVDLVKTNKMNEKKYFAKLGPDALDRRLNYKYLQNPKILA